MGKFDIVNPHGTHASNFDDAGIWLMHLPDRFGVNSVALGDFFNGLETQLNRPVRTDMYNMERSRPDLFEMTRVGNAMLVHNSNLPNDPAVTFSNISFATPMPRKFNIGDREDATAWDFGDFVLDTAGINREGRSCDSGGCVARAAHSLLDGRLTYDEIKKGINDYQAEKGLPQSTFLSAREWKTVQNMGVNPGDPKTTSGARMSVVRHLDPNLVYFRPEFKHGARKKGIMDTLMENVPAFMMGADFRNKRGAHAYAFYDNKPVSTSPLNFPGQLVPKELRDRYVTDTVDEMREFIMDAASFDNVRDKLRRWRPGNHPITRVWTPNMGPQGFRNPDGP